MCMLAGASNWKPDAARLADHCARASRRQPELQAQLCNIRLHLVGVVDARIAGAAVGALERGSTRKLVVSRLRSETVHLVTEAQSVEFAYCIAILPQSVTPQVGTLRRMPAVSAPPASGNCSRQSPEFRRDQRVQHTNRSPSAFGQALCVHCAGDNLCL